MSGEAFGALVSFSTTDVEAAAAAIVPSQSVPLQSEPAPNTLTLPLPIGAAKSTEKTHSQK